MFSIKLNFQLACLISFKITSNRVIMYSFYCAGCSTVVIGDSASQIFLWNHCTGALVTVIKCPQHDAKLQWAGEDQVPYTDLIIFLI